MKLEMFMRSPQKIRAKGQQQERRSVVIEEDDVGFLALWPFAINDDGNSVHSRLYRLARPF
jgi:hypothetical protein